MGMRGHLLMLSITKAQKTNLFSHKTNLSSQQNQPVGRRIYTEEGPLSHSFCHQFPTIHVPSQLRAHQKIWWKSLPYQKLLQWLPQSDEYKYTMLVLLWYLSIKNKTSVRLSGDASFYLTKVKCKAREGKCLGGSGHFTFDTYWTPVVTINEM